MYPNASLYGKCSENYVENRSETREHEARLPLSMSVGQRLGAEIRCIADGETLASCSLLTQLLSHCDDWAISN